MTIEDIQAAVEQFRAIPRPLLPVEVHECESAPNGLVLIARDDEQAQMWREAQTGEPAPLPVISREIPRLDLSSVYRL